MGWLSNIGKIASIAGPIAATVLTGGAAAPTLFAGGAGGIFGKIASMAGPIGSGIGAMSGAAAKNRGTGIEAQLAEEDRRLGRARLQQGDDSNAISAGNLNRQALDDFHTQSRLREVEGREGRRSAMQDLQVANYVGNRGDAPPAVTTSGKTLNTMGLGPRASTDQEKAGMAAAAKEVMMRLEGGNPLEAPTRPTDFQLPSSGVPKLYDQPFNLDPKLLKPGMFERIGDILGPVMTAYGRQGQKAPIDYGMAGNAPYGANPPRV